MIFKNRFEPRNMVGMLVSYENSFDFIVIASDIMQRLTCFLHACARINKYRSTFIFNKSAIGTASAVQRTNSDHVAKKLSVSIISAYIFSCFGGFGLIIGNSNGCTETAKFFNYILVAAFYKFHIGDLSHTLSAKACNNKGNTPAQVA